MEKTTLYVPEELKRRLAELAERRGTSQAALIRRAIEELLAAERPPGRSCPCSADPTRPSRNASTRCSRASGRDRPRHERSPGRDRRGTTPPRGGPTVLEADPGPFLLSPFVLAEIDYLLATRVGVDAELALLREVAAGAYELAPFGPAEVEEAHDLIERYGRLGIGLTDASLVVLAARHGTNRVLTLDERHFRALRPLRGRSFRILPADA